MNNIILNYLLKNYFKIFLFTDGNFLFWNNFKFFEEVEFFKYAKLIFLLHYY